MATLLNDVVDHASKIVANLRRGNPDGHDPVRCNPVITSPITFGIIAAIIGKAVDLNGKSGRSTEEVQDEWAERMLATELEASRLRSQVIP